MAHSEEKLIVRFAIEIRTNVFHHWAGVGLKITDRSWMSAASSRNQSESKCLLKWIFKHASKAHEIENTPAKE